MLVVCAGSDDRPVWSGRNEKWRFGPKGSAKLEEIVTTAHANGQRVRFWATPEMPDPAREAVRRELAAAEVDYINTVNLGALEASGIAGEAAGEPAGSRTSPPPGRGRRTRTR